MHYPTQSLKRTAATFGFAGLLVGGGAGIAGATAQGGDGPGHGQDVACGKVTSVGPAGFTLQGRDGRSETIDTNSSTTYAEPGPGTAPTGVAVGDQVFVKLVPSSSPASGTPTASAVAIEPDWAAAYVKPDGSDRVGGTVASLTSTTVVVDAGGGTRSVLVSPSTVIRQGGQTIGEPSITTGEQIVAVGHPDPVDPADLDASRVDVEPTPAKSPAPAQPATPPTTTAAPTTPPSGPGSQPSAPTAPSTPGSGWSGHASPDPQPPPSPATAGSPSPSGPEPQPAGHGGWSGGSSGGPGNDGGFGGAGGPSGHGGDGGHGH